MYPLLAHKRTLILYLAGWMPITALIAALFVLSGRLSWIPALTLSLPMAFLFAFFCLSAWYLCTAFPLQRTNPFRLVAVHIVAAFLATSTWIMIGSGLANLLGHLPSLESLPEDYHGLIPILLGIGILLFLLGVTVSYLIVFYEKNRESEKRSLEMRLLAQQAEMKALKAQIDPHFLFNSLNSISALTSIDPQGSRRMCQLLSNFMRKSLSLGERKFITLGEEIKLIEDFLAIEQIRLGSRLKVHLTIGEEVKEFALPPLLLQPLVENALNHGIRHLPEGGDLRIGAQKTGNLLKLTVDNPQDPEKPASNGEGIGLDNVHRRLRAVFESGARLDCIENKNSYRAVLTVPVHTLKEVEFDE